MDIQDNGEAFRADVIVVGFTVTTVVLFMEVGRRDARRRWGTTLASGRDWEAQNLPPDEFTADRRVMTFQPPTRNTSRIAIGIAWVTPGDGTGIPGLRIESNLTSRPAHSARYAAAVDRWLFIFAPDICNAPEPLFTGVLSMMQNSPFVKHGMFVAAVVGRSIKPR